MKDKKVKDMFIAVSEMGGFAFHALLTCLAGLRLMNANRKKTWLDWLVIGWLVQSNLNAWQSMADEAKGQWMDMAL